MKKFGWNVRSDVPKKMTQKQLAEGIVMEACECPNKKCRRFPFLQCQWFEE